MAVRVHHHETALAALIAIGLGLAACSSGGQDPSDSSVTTTSAEERVEERVSHTGPEPTAMSYIDGVEVWDLTVEPSVEAFGINWPDRTDRGIKVGAYSSSASGPRPARFLLPGGRSLEMDVNEVIFDVDVHPEGDREVLRFSLTVRGGIEHDSGSATARYRDMISQLGLSHDTVDELQELVADPPEVDPLDPRRGIGVSADLPDTPGMDMGIGMGFYPDDTTFFLPTVGVLWHDREIPW